MCGRTNRWEHPDVRTEDQNVDLPPPAKRVSAIPSIVMLLAKLGRENVVILLKTQERKLAPSSLVIAACALRFLYKVTLKRAWAWDAVIPAPKKPVILPAVLSPDEVVHFLACVSHPAHRTILTTCYATGLCISEAVLQRSPKLTQGCSARVDHPFPPMTRASRDAHEAALLHLPSVVCAGPSRRPSPARVFGVGLSDRSPRADASLVAAA